MCLSVGWSVTISCKDGKFHFHAPIGTLVLFLSLSFFRSSLLSFIKYIKKGEEGTRSKVRDRREQVLRGLEGALNYKEVQYIHNADACGGVKFGDAAPTLSAPTVTPALGAPHKVLKAK